MATFAPPVDKLGAALAASQAVVDAVQAPADWQARQTETGKVAAPSPYVARGISEAVQHRARIKDGKLVEAINQDPKVPIFGVTDDRRVVDLFVAVPDLVVRSGHSGTRGARTYT